MVITNSAYVWHEAPKIDLIDINTHAIHVGYYYNHVYVDRSVQGGMSNTP